MGAADQEEVEYACVDADRHPQGDLAGTGDANAHVNQLLLHRTGRGTATESVPITGEEEQQSVPTEFEEAAAEGIGGSKELMKGRGNDAGEFLGPELSMFRQTFGNRGETRDVDKDHRAFETLVQSTGSFLIPLPHHPRQVGLRGGLHACRLGRWIAWGPAATNGSRKSKCQRASPMRIHRFTKDFDSAPGAT